MPRRLFQSGASQLKPSRLLTTVLLVAAACQGVTVAAGPTEEAAEAARRWDLLGVWKSECRTGPSVEDVSFRYIIRSGRLYQERDTGGGKDSNLVSLAEASRDGMTIELTIMFAAGPRTIVLRRQGAHQLLVWSSRLTGSSEYNIKDGKFVDGNVGRPLLTHCSRYGDK
jgi:hypothetical protein